MSSQLAHPLVRACSLAAALALASCTADASRDSLAPTAPVRSAATAPLPFRGTVELIRISVTPLGPAKVLSHSEGTGTATHLGRYSIVAETTIDFAARTSTAQRILTAANGDALFVTVTAQATPNADGVTFNVVESATITGGTGRFAGATGTYTANCVSNQVTGTSTGTFEGTITLDH